MYTKIAIKSRFFFLGNLESLFTHDQSLWSMKTELNLCTLGHNINKNCQLESIFFSVRNLASL